MLILASIRITQVLVILTIIYYKPSLLAVSGTGPQQTDLKLPHIVKMDKQKVRWDNQYNALLFVHKGCRTLKLFFCIQTC